MAVGELPKTLSYSYVTEQPPILAWSNSLEEVGYTGRHGEWPVTMDTTDLKGCGGIFARPKKKPNKKRLKRISQQLSKPFATLHGGTGNRISLGALSDTFKR